MEKLNFNWESEEERLRRFMKIPAKKKLEALQKIHEFMLLAATKQRKKIFWRLRGIRT